MKLFILDLNFKDHKGEIATYLLPHNDSMIIVDPGPESTLPNLVSVLHSRGLTPRDVTHVLLTHIHLDHAGAAGWFAKQGAQVYVHPAGAPHLFNPEKLLASASRLYGELMERLWGEVKPVPAKRLTEVQNEMEISAGGLRIFGIQTPGHAEHHLAYIFEDVLLSGDVGGIRFGSNSYVRLPFVLPETHLGKWRTSLKRMLAPGASRIAPTHFGVYNDAEKHLAYAIQFLEEVEDWLGKNMRRIPDIETLTMRYGDFLHSHSLAAGVDELMLKVYDGGNPISFATSGLFRFWQKLQTET